MSIIESLLVMSTLGIQLTTTFGAGQSHSIFYDMTKVKDIVINEAITMVSRSILICLF